MSGVQPDTKESVRFLGVFRPEGPWVLTAISTDQKEIKTETFESLDAAEVWIDARNGKHNLYFAVNPVLRPLFSKAKKTDVRSMGFTHVDIDPRAGEELDPERARIRKLLFEFKPEPTFIADSGGGYQAFWRLSKEEVINGDEARAEELERYNIKLELLLGADSCHNVDRVMRLPGTINLPNEKKLKKGRVPALAMVVMEKPGNVYPLSTFTPAQRVTQRGNGAKGGFVPTDPVKISGNLPKIDLGQLPTGVSARIKMLIVQGEDPDDPGRYKSQSEVVFAVACELVRAGCSDDTIASVMLDKDFGISEHIYRQGRPVDYTARQVRRARDHAIHPKLAELNEKHWVVEDIGGKCRVISEVFDPALKRSRLSRQSFDDFRNRYMNIEVELGKDEDGKLIKMQLGKFWLGHKDRRQYTTIVFSPACETPGCYNLWRGFACDARPGSCDLYLDHIRKNICGGDAGYYDYVLNWMARCVQQPDSPGEVAIVLRGRMGTGKGKFAKVFGDIWGRHFVHITDPKHLIGSFNSHLRDCVLLFADEAFYAGDKKHEAILRGLVTEETIMIEAKGVDAEAAPNFVHLIMASNSAWVVPAGDQERRFFVLDVGEANMQDKPYFAAIDAEMDNGGREALLNMLLSRDITQFEVRNFPKTSALIQQKVLSLPKAQKIVYEMLQNGSPPVAKTDGGSVFIATHDLWVYTGDKASESALGAELSIISDNVDGIARREQCGKMRKKGFWLPQLSEARRRWADAKGLAGVRWLKDDGQWLGGDDDGSDGSDGSDSRG